jgi:hypothetical protein
VEEEAIIALNLLTEYDILNGFDSETRDQLDDLAVVALTLQEHNKVLPNKFFETIIPKSWTI